MDNRNSIITTNGYLDNAPESMPGHDHAKKHFGEEVPVVKRKGCFAITSITKVPNNDSSSEESSDDDDVAPSESPVSRPTAALTVSLLARGCEPTLSEKLSPVVSAGVSQPDAPKECRFKIVELHPKKPVKAAAAQKTYTRGRWGVIDSFYTIGSKPTASATSTPIAPVQLSPNNGTTTPSSSPASESLPVSSPKPPATASSTPSTSTSRFRIVTLYEDKTAKKPAAKKPALAAGPYKKGRWTVTDSFSAPTKNTSVDSPSAGGIAAQIFTNTPKAKAAPGPAIVATGLKLELKSTSSGAGDTQHCPVVRETDMAAPSLTIQVTSPQQIPLPASLSQDNASKSRRPRQEPTEAPTTPAVPSPAAAQRPTVVSEPSLAVGKTKPASAKAAPSKRSSTICITSVRRANSILRRPKLATIREMEEPQEAEQEKSQGQPLFAKIVQEQFAIYASLHDRI